MFHWSSVRAHPIPRCPEGARHDALTADPDVVGVFDGVRHAVIGAEPEEDADPRSGGLGLAEVLVEVIVDGPCVVPG